MRSAVDNGDEPLSNRWIKIKPRRKWKGGTDETGDSLLHARFFAEHYLYGTFPKNRSEPNREISSRKIECSRTNQVLGQWFCFLFRGTKILSPAVLLEDHPQCFNLKEKKTIRISCAVSTRSGSGWLAEGAYCVFEIDVRKRSLWAVQLNTSWPTRHHLSSSLRSHQFRLAFRNMLADLISGQTGCLSVSTCSLAKCLARGATENTIRLSVM